MSQDEPVIKSDQDPEPIEKIRTEEPQAPFGQDEPNPDVVSDATAADKGLEGDDAAPGLGGYAERDPKEEMPRIPSEESTQEDSHPHGGAPKTDKEPPASTSRVGPNP